MVVGDSNFHVDNASNREALLSLELIDSFSLEQHARVPTHQQGHTLDSLLRRSSDHSVFDFATGRSQTCQHLYSRNRNKSGPILLSGDVTIGDRIL